jgi:hypothetical protein
LGIRAAIGISLVVAGGCASRDESVGCAQLVVNCPSGTEQQWWLATKTTPTPVGDSLRVQGGECGSWLAYIRDGATASYTVDVGAREGEMRLRVVVAADDANTQGGTLSLTVDSATTPIIPRCAIPKTGGWFNWIVVDCGPVALTGMHTFKFGFSGLDPSDLYVFNFAAFGIVRSGSPDCTVTGPKMRD